MLRKFVKMEGAGNDYIYFDCLREPLASPENLAVRLSDRHRGIGGDGIVLICPSGRADAKMRMFNADGSEGKMCGNAIRCVGKYLFESGAVPKSEMEIETLSGIKRLGFFPKAERSAGARGYGKGRIRRRKNSRKPSRGTNHRLSLTARGHAAAHHVRFDGQPALRRI